MSFVQLLHELNIRTLKCEHFLRISQTLTSLIEFNQAIPRFEMEKDALNEKRNSDMKYKRISQLYRLDKLEKDEGGFSQAKRVITNGTKKLFQKIRSDGFVLKCLKMRLPFLDWLPKYSLKTHLIADMIAGFTVGKQPEQFYTPC